MDIRKEFENNQRLFLDGAMGTRLQKKGLKPGELPETWNTSHSDIVRDIHKSYFDAGSNIVITNTCCANIFHFDKNELEHIVAADLENIRKAAELSTGKQRKYAALEIGPLGRLLKPFGDLEFEQAVEAFAIQVRLGVKYGADLIFLETFNDSYETKAAVIAAKENSDLPLFVSNAYGADGKLLTGASPKAMAAMLEGLGADAIGANCSLGPSMLLPVVREIMQYASVPVLVKPNAGLPVQKDGRTVFNVSAADFAEEMREMAAMGVRILGGCCGTDDEYIRKTISSVSDIPFAAPASKTHTIASSYSRAVEFGAEPVIIGERINPTGKKLMKDAIVNRKTDYVLKEAIGQEDAGADVLDVNAGVPGIDETAVLSRLISEIQAVCGLPLQIDSSDSKALAAALRIYNGKAIVNSVNGKWESMDSVFPVVKKYGGLVVALTLDEKGIPDTAEGRVEIAEKIASEAIKYGIGKENLIFDALTLTVGAKGDAALVTLKTVGMLKERGFNTTLGISNVSFGLPSREKLNAAFLTMALTKGLSSAIINPYSEDIKDAVNSFRLLSGLSSDRSFLAVKKDYAASASDLKPDLCNKNTLQRLQDAIIHGFKEEAGMLCTEILAGDSAADIVNGCIIPALNIVGKGFENKTVYLPQLLMSADSAKQAFEKIKAASLNSGKAKNGRDSFVIATVKGDIHDIGKNIVSLLMENYGFDVTDLGKDVSPEIIAEAVSRTKSAICGLSALMTTTVPAMEETIKLLRKCCPWCKIVVGGAVLTKEYAQSIGADFYAKDAMETVRYAENIYGDKR